MLVHVLSICLYIVSDDENKDDQSLQIKIVKKHISCSKSLIVSHGTLQMIGT